MKLHFRTKCKKHSRLLHFHLSQQLENNFPIIFNSSDGNSLILQQKPMRQWMKDKRIRYSILSTRHGTDSLSVSPHCCWFQPLYTYDNNKYKNHASRDVATWLLFSYVSVLTWHTLPTFPFKYHPSFITPLQDPLPSVLPLKANTIN